MQPVPAHREVVQVGVGEARDRQLRDKFFQRLAVQRIEDHITILRILAHHIHRRGIDRAPAVDQRGPVGLDAPLLAPCGEIVDQARAPVDDGAEDVEHQCFYGRNVRHVDFLVFVVLGFLLSAIPGRP